MPISNVPQAPEPQTDRTALRRRAWIRALYILLLISAIFAAWQAHDLWQSDREPSSTDGTGPPPSVQPSGAGPTTARARPRIRSAPRAATRPSPTTQSQPATMFTDLFPEPPAEALDEDPVGVPPPQGATPTGPARKMRDLSVVARYAWAGTAAEAAEYYRQTLEGDGCKLLDSSIGEDGRQYLKFQAAERRVVVALRQNPQDAKMVDIEVTVMRPAK